MSLADKGLVSSFANEAEKVPRQLLDLLKVTRLFCGKIDTGQGLPTLQLFVFHGSMPLQETSAHCLGLETSFSTGVENSFCECIVHYVFNTVFIYSFQAPQS